MQELDDNKLLAPFFEKILALEQKLLATQKKLEETKKSEQCMIEQRIKADDLIFEIQKMFYDEEISSRLDDDCDCFEMLKEIKESIIISDKSYIKLKTENSDLQQKLDKAVEFIKSVITDADPITPNYRLIQISDEAKTTLEEISKG